MVYLKAGQTIAVLSPKSEAKGKKAKEKGQSKEKDIQQVTAEGKEG